VFRPHDEEMLVPTVRTFMKTDGFRDYILDGEVGIVRFSRYLCNYTCFGSVVFVLRWCAKDMGE